MIDLSILMLTALSAPFAAPDTLVGKKAPAFSFEGCLFEPRLSDSESLLGEVVLLKFWGTT